jgi:hypothetical protein
VANGPQPGDISGNDVNRYGDIAYTSTNFKTGKAGLTIRSHGRSTFVDLSAFKKKYNPDGKVHYGTTSTNSCVLNFLKAADFPTYYTGIVDSHPYSVAAVKGGWVVGDAGGNDVLFVDSKGATSRSSPSCRRSPTRSRPRTPRRSMPLTASSVSPITSSRFRPTSRSAATARCTSARCPAVPRRPASRRGAACGG